MPADAMDVDSSPAEPQNIQTPALSINVLSRIISRGWGSLDIPEDHDDAVWIEVLRLRLVTLLQTFTLDARFMDLVAKGDWRSILAYSQTALHHPLYWNPVLPLLCQQLGLKFTDEATLTFIRTRASILERRRERVETDAKKLIEARDFKQLASFIYGILSQEPPIFHGVPSIQAFQAQFEGKAHLVFLSTLDWYKEGAYLKGTTHLPPSSVHSYSTSIVQSSCMGKTKTMHEAANERFAIILNVRERLPGGQITYPPADAIVRGFLVDEVSSFTYDQIRQRYMSFLCSLFNNLRKELMNLDFGNKQLCRIWHEHITNPYAPHVREAFFQRVINSIQPVTPDDLQACTTTLFHSVIRPAGGKDELPVQLLLVFDEAHTLAAPINNDGEQQRTYLYVFEDILKSLKRFPLFTVFLSTNSKVEARAPAAPVVRHPSWRSDKQLKFIPPLTEINSFDAYAKTARGFLEEGGLTLNNLCMPQFVCFLGRPIWGAMFKVSQDIEPVRTFAMNKLGRGISDPTYEEHLAWFSIRVMFDLDSTIQARQWQSRLVELYMRTVSSIPSRGEPMTTCAPSEPMLAEAAAYLMLKLDYFDILNKAIKFGLLPKGERRGEIAMRALLTRAHDLTIRNMSLYSEPLNGLRFHRPILLLDLLSTLLVPGAFNILLDAKSVHDETGHTTVRDAFQNTWVHFSQFVQAGDYEVLKPPTLIEYFFHRGCAIQCCDDQYGVDVMLPTMNFKPADDPLNTTFTTADGSVVQFEVKDRVRPPDAPDSLIPWTVCFEPTEEQPYITKPLLSLQFELGAPTFPDVGALALPYYTSLRETCDSTPRNLHYQVHLYGQEALALNPLEKEEFSRFLNVQHVYDDFPRAGRPENQTLRNQCPANVTLEVAESWGQ